MNIDERAQEIERQAKEYVDKNLLGVPKGCIGEMVLFIGMKYLYIAFKNKLDTTDQIRTEKRKLITAFQAAMQDREWYLAEAKKRNRVSSELVELEKCNCEHCRRVIRLFDGREGNA